MKYYVRSTELYHHGVKGMKWGHRKKPEEGESGTRKLSRKERKEQQKEERREARKAMIAKLKKSLLYTPTVDDDDEDIDDVDDDRDDEDENDDAAKKQAYKKALSDKYGEAGKQQGYADNARKRGEEVKKAYLDEADLLDTQAAEYERYFPKFKQNEIAQLRERSAFLKSEADRLGKEAEAEARAYEESAKRAKSDADYMSMESRVYLGEDTVTRLMEQSRQRGASSAQKYDNYTQRNKNQIAEGRRLSEEILSGVDRDSAKLSKSFKDMDAEFDNMFKSDFDW